jgi:hypothetical protein
MLGSKKAAQTLCALLALLLCTLAPPALAQSETEPANVDEDAGRQLAGEAMGHYKEGELAEAIEVFNRAREVYPTGQVLRMTGYTLLALDRWIEAANAIEAALKTQYKPLMPRDAEHAEDQLKKAMSHVGVVSVTSSVDGAMVAVDGGPSRVVPARILLEPGPHQFVVTARRHDHAESEETIGAGEEVNISLDPTPLAAGEEPKPLPKPKPKPEPEEESGSVFGWFPGQGTVGLIVAGVGVVAGGIGLGVGLSGASLESAVQENIDVHNQNYDASCSTNTQLCNGDIQLINGDGERAADLQDAGLVTGLIGVGLFAVGATLFLMSEDSPFAPADDGEGDSLSMMCGPSPMGGACFGTF